MTTELKQRVWAVKSYGWGSVEGDFRQAFLDKYFPGRLCLKRNLDGCRFAATEEEVAFCEFDCGAIIEEILWPNSSF